jgi:FkbH-like protein
VLEAVELAAHYPVSECFDHTADELGHLPFSAEYQAALALTITRKLWQLRRTTVKVMAVDGDNTLWGGIAGEIGPLAVDLSGPYAILASKLLALRAAGVLLVLVSKNDESTLLEVLARQDSVLSKAHFSIIAHGWDSKSARLERCAKTLNLGLDSFVFLDDNPAEIAQMEAHLPQVLAITIPEADELEQLLPHLWVLDVPETTAEDRNRANFYQVEQERQSVREASEDFEKFIAALQIEMNFERISPANPASQERTIQLSRRTNQFNLRPKELDVAELEKFNAAGGEVWTASVKDRFGDYGQVCIILLQKNGPTLHVINWMLSCRVLGRGVEQRVLQWLANQTEANQCDQLCLSAEKRPRNIPARRLVSALGGDPVEAELLQARVSPQQLRAFQFSDLESKINE